MLRLHFDAHEGTPPAVGPDMTILEAADALERSHGSRILVRARDHFVGLLTEADIVRKVLAAGRRPDMVRVADIMRVGREGRDGTLLLEEDRTPPAVDDAPPASLVSHAQGKCEECGAFNVDLEEAEGLLVCGDCTDLFRVRGL